MASENKNVCAYPWQQVIIDLTGEVVPCCFWSGYGNTGKALGNTNLNTLDEIWNGSEYQALRRANSSGALKGHPCHECMAYRWSNGVYPAFSWPVPIRKDEGFCYRIEQLPEAFMRATVDARDEARLYEDGVEMPGREAIHEDIRRSGLGRYSLWGDTLFFSTSDNSNPTANGRVYELRCREHRAVVAGIIANSPSGRNMLKAYEEYRAGIENMEAKPTMISLISTADCNIDCPGCSQNTVRLTRVQLRASTVPDVLAHVPYLQQFIWHGGEPYLIKRFRAFIDEYKTDDNPNLAFGFTSNGTMLTAKELEKLKKFPRINASISIDSFNKETFERIRKGASYENVVGNYLRALSLSDAPFRIFSCGMIICKSNFLELADNLRFAIEHDVGVNLSPVLIYPVTEQLNVFEDYEQQTKGWQTALDSAREVVARARMEKRRAIRRVDPSGMLEELQSILNAAATCSSKTVAVKVRVHDEHQSLAKMQRPGMIIFEDGTGKALSYCEFSRGAGSYVAFVPGDSTAASVFWGAVHNLTEPMGMFASGRFVYGDEHDRACFFAGSKVLTTHVAAPAFTSVPRLTNIHFASYGETTPKGIHVTKPRDINKAYHRVVLSEAREGYGVTGSSFAQRTRELMHQYATRMYQILSGPRR